MSKSQEIVSTGNSGLALAETSLTSAYVDWLRQRHIPGRWHSDPGQSCLHYKVYRGVQQIPLDTSFPLSLGRPEQEPLRPISTPVAQTPEQKLSWMLYYTHGLTRMQRPAPGSVPVVRPSAPGSPTLPRTITGPHAKTPSAYSRPVPSGGNLHPVELYLVVGTGWHIPPGVYHYDCVRHALDVLRTEAILPDLAACLPTGTRLDASSLLVLPAVLFQKNHQKYEEFSYQLQMLDTGIVVEQVRSLARYFGLSGSVSLEFLDQPLHHVIGLDPREECIYALCALHQSAPDETGGRSQDDDRLQSLHVLAALPDLPFTYLQPFEPIKRNAFLDDFSAAALLKTLPEKPVTLALSNISLAPATGAEHDDDAGLPLPQVPLASKADLATILLRRHTSFNAIDTRPVALSDLAALLRYAAQGCSQVWETCACQFYAVLMRVEGMPAGVYRYNFAGSRLTRLHVNALFEALQRSATASNAQPCLVPVTLFMTGDYARALAQFGERGLRIMGLEVGRILQRLTFAGSARGLATHVHLSYVHPVVEEELLCLPSPSQLPLACMMLGLPRAAQEGLLEALWY